jgi:CotS family spore coat protein
MLIKEVLYTYKYKGVITMMREFEIERQFQIKIDIIKANKGIYYLKTNKGERCLKKINYGPQKLLFVYGAKEHLISNGFTNVDRYFLNIDGEPYALVNEDLYTLSEWLEGRECDFHNIEEVKIASATLAKLHEASKGYDPPENSKLKTDLGRWPSLMEKRIKSLDKMRDMIRKKNNKSNFDLLYLKSMEFYKEIGRKALKTLKESSYEELCEITEAEKSFCHHDYTYHNIILDSDNNVSVIDFDYCKREIRAFDISNFMIKVLKRCNWNLDFAIAIIESYNEVSKLREDEYQVLYAYLLFPQRYWRLANRYYYNEVNWGQNTFASKLESIINERDNYLAFLDSFKNKYNICNLE